MLPSLSRPPLECCFGTNPIQAEKLRPDRKLLGSPTLATSAVGATDDTWNPYVIGTVSGGHAETNSSGQVIKDTNDVAGGSAVNDLIAWGRTNWPT